MADIFFHVKTSRKRFANFRDLVIKICPACGGRDIAWRETEQLDLFDRDPERWPDAIRLGNGPGFALSGWVVTELENAGVRVPTFKAECFGTKIVPAKYIVLMPPRAIDLDLAKSGLIFCAPCGECGMSPIKQQPTYCEEVLQPETWSGELLFRARNAPFGSIFCSMKFVELARRQFRFVRCR